MHALHPTRIPLPTTPRGSPLCSDRGSFPSQCPVTQRAVSTYYTSGLPALTDRHPKHHRRAHLEPGHSLLKHTADLSHGRQSVPRTCVCRASHQLQLRGMYRNSRRTRRSGVDGQRRCDERFVTAGVGLAGGGCVQCHSVLRESDSMQHTATVLMPAILHCHGRRTARTQCGRRANR